MALHPLAQKFAGVATEYEHGRPDYPAAAVGALAAELGLTPDSKVLDLGAGTGKLTRALLAGGLDVVAVEPQEELRTVLAGHVGAERALQGTAEAIPLEDASIDAVTIADAFHWFDRGPALAEIHRVLRPGGGLALTMTAPDWGEAAWGHDLGNLIAQRRTHHPFFDDTPFEETLRATPGWSSLRDVHVRVRQSTSRERLLDYVRSMSWVAAMANEQREAFVAEAAALVGDIPAAGLPVRFLMWLAERG